MTPGFPERFPGAPPSEEVFFSTLKIGTCLFASVPPQLRDAHARALQDTLATRLGQEKGVSGLILDVSALGIVDSYVARVLEEIGSSSKSLGARAILVGLRPTVAITLVELGIDLTHVGFAMSLEKAMRMLNMRIVADR